MYSTDVLECYQGNLGLVHKVARNCYRRLQAIGAAMDFEDVVGEVRQSLVVAHASFDPNQGFEFCTYFGRAAYNHMNRIAERVELERIENATYSIEEINAGRGENATPVEETISSDAMTPDEVLEAKQRQARAVRMTERLSPVAQLIVEWLVNPPPELLAEIARHRAHAEVARGMGLSRRSHAGLTLDFVSKMIGTATGLPAKTIMNARREVQDVIDSL
ncbi:hypothetical protein N5B55_04680 [Ralstonia pickettii]|uniref:sigma factor n=1 Tax=Ralstonia pickettii TaxID=329 RepID=UPI002714A4D7|nr:sigma factor [Ralstonia pickettii]WKZ86248.1 hypothetical protein N5B55_04680 [Ralstonia pickettii]